jgi:hypothetical protein
MPYHLYLYLFGGLLFLEITIFGGAASSSSEVGHQGAGMAPTLISIFGEAISVSSIAARL